MIKANHHKKLNDIYKVSSPENIPWNISTPPRILKQLLANKIIKPCKTLEVGCGTGNYSIYLAGQGFEVTAIDISECAIVSAKEKAKEKGVICNFMQADILEDANRITGTFDFIFDWFVLHHIFPENREKFVRNIFRLLNPGGKYLSVCFSENNVNFGGSGKYRKTTLDTTLYFSSEDELKQLFVPLFKIRELKTIDIEENPNSHLAVYAFVLKE